MAKYNIPLTLIFKCVHNEQLLALYYYYKLRNVHKNNVFYNATYSSLSETLKLSRPNIKKYIQIMVDNGWCNFYTNPKTRITYLKLIGITKLNKLYKGVIVQIPVMDSRKAQLAAFRYAILHKDLRIQQYAVDRKNRIVKSLETKRCGLSKKDYKYYRKNFKNLSHLETSITDCLTLSNKKIGSLSLRSERTGSNYQCQMRELGLIKTKPRFRVIMEDATLNSYFHYRELNNFPKGVIYFNNTIYQQKSNQIIPSIAFKNSGSNSR